MAVAERELTIPAPGAEGEWIPQPYCWTREQFYQMGDLGRFEGPRVILVEGEIIDMPPMKPPHQSMTASAARQTRSWTSRSLRAACAIFCWRIPRGPR